MQTETLPYFYLFSGGSSFFLISVFQPVLFLSGGAFLHWAVGRFKPGTPSTYSLCGDAHLAFYPAFPARALSIA